jgi:hypothetical protein
MTTVRPIPSLHRGADTKGTLIHIRFNSGHRTGEFESCICFVFLKERSFSKVYKITGKNT